MDVNDNYRDTKTNILYSSSELISLKGNDRGCKDKTLLLVVVMEGCDFTL